MAKDKPPITPLKRYHIHASLPSMVDGEFGPWVKHADVERAMIELSTYVLEQVRQSLRRNSNSAIYVAETQGTRKRKGERDTEFIKRIAVAMFDSTMAFEREDADALAKGENPFSPEAIKRKADRMNPDGA